MASKNAKRASRGAKKSAKKVTKPASEGAPEANVPPTRATGAESATGTAIAEARRDDIPQGEDRGSKVAIEGGEPQPDYLDDGTANKNPEEPAVFSSNGQILPGTAPSPSGPVSVSATGANALGGAEAGVKAPDSPSIQAQKDFNAQRAAAQEESKADVLDEQTVSRLSKTDLRAIGHQRGYDMPDTGGTRTMRAAFLAGQKKASETK